MIQATSYISAVLCRGVCVMAYKRCAYGISISRICCMWLFARLSKLQHLDAAENALPLAQLTCAVRVTHSRIWFQADRPTAFARTSVPEPIIACPWIFRAWNRKCLVIANADAFASFLFKGGSFLFFHTFCFGISNPLATKDPLFLFVLQLSWLRCCLKTARSLNELWLKGNPIDRLKLQVPLLRRGQCAELLMDQFAGSVRAAMTRFDPPTIICPCFAYACCWSEESSTIWKSLGGARSKAGSPWLPRINCNIWSGPQAMPGFENFLERRKQRLDARTFHLGYFTCAWAMIVREGLLWIFM